MPTSDEMIQNRISCIETHIYRFVERFHKLFSQLTTHREGYLRDPLSTRSIRVC